MRPALLDYLNQLGIHVYVPGYKALYIGTVAIALALATALAVRKGLPGRRFYAATVLICTAAFVGGRAFSELRNADGVNHSLLSVLTRSDTGSVGVYLGAIGFGFIILNLMRLDVLASLDIYAPVAALSLAIGRLGCFMSGCCYGKTSSLPWAVSYPRGSAAYINQLTAGVIASDARTSLPVHPTQLYEAVFGVGLFLLLIRRGRRPRVEGMRLFAYLASYAVLRFGVELFRGDDRGQLLGLSLPQVFSLGLLLFGLAGIVYCAQAARRHGAGTQTIGSRQVCRSA